ncbi:protein of unknown function [Nitratireductor aquimarinus]
MKPFVILAFRFQPIVAPVRFCTAGTVHSGRLAWAFFSSGKEGENVRTSGLALADNANADNGAQRFHRRSYRRRQQMRQD